MGCSGSKAASASEPTAATTTLKQEAAPAAPAKKEEDAAAVAAPAAPAKKEEAAVAAAAPAAPAQKVEAAAAAAAAPAAPAKKEEEEPKAPAPVQETKPSSDTATASSSPSSPAVDAETSKSAEPAGEDDAKTKAATKIQATQRGSAARKAVAEKKEKELHATSSADDDEDADGERPKAQSISLAGGEDSEAVHDLTGGWLYKKGHKIKNWKRRWFALDDPGESIAYFNNEVASGEDVNVKMSNVIRVKGSTLYPTVKGKEAKEKDGKFYFTIEGQVESLETVKLYKLYATSAEERKKWVDGLLALGMTDGGSGTDGD